MVALTPMGTRDRLYVSVHQNARSAWLCIQVARERAVRWRLLQHYARHRVKANALGLEPCVRPSPHLPRGRPRDLEDLKKKPITPQAQNE